MNENRPHHIYRALDGYGLLLYVGCTVNPDQRLATHRSSSAWYRFAESIGVGSARGRREALDLERLAIDTEGPYFNASFADMKRTQANRVASRRSLRARGDHEDVFGGAIDDMNEDNPEWVAHCERSEAWDRRHEAERERLKAGAFWYLTDQDRLARYLAARGAASLAGVA